MERVVLSMKWGTPYSSDYVNVLYRACKAHITGDFRFACLTDDATGIDSGVETFPIPEIGCTPAHFAAGAWPKLSVFTSPLYDLKGRALFIDLDVVILKSLDPFFEVSETFHTIGMDSGWRHGKTVGANPNMNTSVFGFEIGDQTKISSTFSDDPNAASARFGNEQEFVEGTIDAWQPWPEPWVISYKRHIRRKSLLAPILGAHPVPDKARIVAFHGKPNPTDLLNASDRSGLAWIGNYWRTYLNE